MATNKNMVFGIFLLISLVITANCSVKCKQSKVGKLTDVTCDKKCMASMTAGFTASCAKGHESLCDTKNDAAEICCCTSDNCNVDMATCKKANGSAKQYGSFLSMVLLVGAAILASSA